MPNSAASYGYESQNAFKLPGWVGPAVGTAVAIGGTIYSARAAKKEAEKNRAFQERMSSTSHQREVKDLQAAGLNPMISAHGGAPGAAGSMPDLPDFGEAGQRAIASALALKRMGLENELLRAQADNTYASANEARVRAGDILNTAAAGRMDLIRQQVASGRMTLQQQKDIMPLLVAKAREEVGLTAASARAHRAVAMLDELAASGAFNEAEFQKTIGKAGPWTKLFLQAAGKIGVGAVGGAMLLKGRKGGKWSPSDASFVKGGR